MKKAGSLFKASLKELDNFKTVVLCALFMAIAVILGYFSIDGGPFLKISFARIPGQIVAALFGPVTAGIFGAILDILKFTVKPTGPFFPGFTLDEVLVGVLYGLFFYKREIKLWRILVAHLAVTLAVNLGTTTYWLSVVGGKGFLAIWPVRALKNAIMLPIDSLIFFSIMKSLWGAVKSLPERIAGRGKDKGDFS